MRQPHPAPRNPAKLAPAIPQHGANPRTPEAHDRRNQVRSTRIIPCAAASSAALFVLCTTAAVLAPGPTVHSPTIRRSAPVSADVEGYRGQWALPPPAVLEPTTTTTVESVPKDKAAPAVPPARPRPRSGVSAAGAAPTSSGGYEACVIRRESGGSATAQNPHSSASGLYGFLGSTWHAVTGLSGEARDYSPAVQRSAFLKLYAEEGSRPWASDRCS
jgi:hypothetical protein